jgi:hypothetical protein
MLDWFSQRRVSGEHREDTKGPEQQQILRDYVFHRPDGRLLSLSQIGVPLVLVFLPAEFAARQTYFVEWLRGKLQEVRGLQTRLIVVVHPEDLYTVVALAGDLLIVSDETGDAMLALGSDAPIFYSINREHEIVRTLEQDELAA